jgi:hypothetical protein
VRLARRLLLALWAGVLVSIGGLAAPTVFHVLGNPAAAGRIAVELFERTTILSGALALALLVLAAADRAALSLRLKVAPLWPALALAANTLVLRALMAGAASGSGEFQLWHSLAAVLYLAATAGVVALLVVELRRER